MTGTPDPGSVEPPTGQEGRPVQGKPDLTAGADGHGDPSNGLPERGLDLAREGYDAVAAWTDGVLGVALGALGGLSGVVGLAKLGTWAIDRKDKRKKDREAGFDEAVERVLGKRDGEFLDDLRGLLASWEENRRLRRVTRKTEARYGKRRRAFLRDMRALRGPLVELKRVMLRDHPEASDSGALGLQIGLGSPGESFGLARFDELAAGSGLGESDAVPSQADDSPPDRNPAEEEYTFEMRMLHILWIRRNRLVENEDLGGPRVSAEFLRRYHQLEGRRAEIVHAFADWKRTRAEAALHELRAAKRALDNPLVSAEQHPDSALYAMTLGFVGLYDLMEDHTLRPEDLPKDTVTRARARELLRLYRRLLERAALELRKAL